MNELLINEERFLEQYRYLFEELLHFHTVINSRVYESVNLRNNSVSSRPLTIETLLRKNTLPAFRFLVCKN
ncbi:hypothetical protein [Ferruginibacter profundus]